MGQRDLSAGRWSWYGAWLDQASGSILGLARRRLGRPLTPELFQLAGIERGIERFDPVE
jgi:hypothetical protein